MAEQTTGVEINPYAIIGEKQVRLEVMQQYAQGLEVKVAELQAQVETQAAKLAELQADPQTQEIDMTPFIEPDAEAADMVAEGSPG